jgi:adenine-specific DNA-methyltransferase
MEKLKMQTANVVDENIKRIGELFPNCLTERLDENGRPEVAIDFDQLRQELSKDIVEGPEERYQFTWPDKRNAIRLANAPTTDTLRPCREESVDFDNTQNLYIEGDNLEVLKLLRENYLGKVKMIYIDPPYNTGNDFVYNDEFNQEKQKYIHNSSGQYDEEGNRLVANTESNGRFHTDWLNMIYPRLKVAKDLLSEDGVIFISMDENEIDNLEKVCNEIYGEHNLVGKVIWERAFAPKNDAKYFSDSHDYVIVYARNINAFSIGLLPRTDEANARYKNPDNDPKGPWTPDNMTVKTYSAAYDYEITTPNGTIMSPPNGRCWFTSKERMNKLIEEGRVWFGEDGGNMPRLKRYLADVQQGMTPITIWKNTEVGHNQEGRQELKLLFDGKGFFDGPKPLRLLSRIIRIANVPNDSIILDFFSGSATTAHAVMQLNAEDGGNRKFIMVQLPESTDEKSEAFKAGYKNICEIGKERIRRAGKKILEEQKIKIDASRETLDFSGDSNLGSKVSGLKPVDVGFRVLKLDSSNMQDVYYSPEEFNENLLFEDNLKLDRTDEDLLFQAMIELGIELSAKIECLEFSRETLDFSDETTAGKGLTSNASKLKPKIKVWNVAEGYLMACFDNDVNETAIKAIAKQHPYYFVLRDASLATDQVADNFEQIWEEYSKDTIRKIL